MNGTSVELQEIEDQMEEIGTKSDFLYRLVKRTFDILVSLLALLICLPFFLIIIVAIKCDSKGKIFYKHKRIGKNGYPIYVYKFRTMYQDADKRLKELLKNPKIRKEWEENYKLDNDPRITRVGKFLRNTSLDELPQLINILNGDMSIVGPRPIIEGEIEKYGANKEKFLSVTPGLTGWWACNGRSCTTYEERMALELYYIDHRSILLDIKCIIKTFGAVIRKSGAK